MIFTFQTALQVLYGYWGPTATLKVTDTNGYAMLYAYTPLPDGTARLNGAIGLGNESDARRTAAECFINYQLNPSASIQVQRLANGVIEVFNPNEPAHVGGNPTRYFVMSGRVSTLTYVAGSGPNAYAAQVNTWLAAKNYS